MSYSHQTARRPQDERDVIAFTNEELRSLPSTYPLKRTNIEPARLPSHNIRGSQLEVNISITMELTLQMLGAPPQTSDF